MTSCGRIVLTTEEKRAARIGTPSHPGSSSLFPEPAPLLCLPARRSLVSWRAALSSSPAPYGQNLSKIYIWQSLCARKSCSSERTVQAATGALKTLRQRNRDKPFLASQS